MAANRIKRTRRADATIAAVDSLFWLMALLVSYFIRPFTDYRMGTMNRVKKRAVIVPVVGTVLLLLLLALWPPAHANDRQPLGLSGSAAQSLEAGNRADGTRNPDATPSISLHREPRELGGFFIIGIAINLVMVVVFILWFSREWHRSTKRRNTSR